MDYVFNAPSLLGSFFLLIHAFASRAYHRPSCRLLKPLAWATIFLLAFWLLLPPPLYVVSPHTEIPDPNGNGRRQRDESDTVEGQPPVHEPDAPEGNDADSEFEQSEDPSAVDIRWELDDWNVHEHNHVNAVSRCGEFVVEPRTMDEDPLPDLDGSPLTLADIIKAIFPSCVKPIGETPGNPPKRAKTLTPKYTGGNLITDADRINLHAAVQAARSESTTRKYECNIGHFIGWSLHIGHCRPIPHPYRVYSYLTWRHNYRPKTKCSKKMTTSEHLKYILASLEQAKGDLEQRYHWSLGSPLRQDPSIHALGTIIRRYEWESQVSQTHGPSAPKPRGSKPSTTVDGTSRRRRRSALTNELPLYPQEPPAQPSYPEPSPSLHPHTHPLQPHASSSSPLPTHPPPLDAQLSYQYQTDAEAPSPTAPPDTPTQHGDRDQPLFWGRRWWRKDEDKFLLKEGPLSVAEVWQEFRYLGPAGKPPLVLIMARYGSRWVPFASGEGKNCRKNLWDARNKWVVMEIVWRMAKLQPEATVLESLEEERIRQGSVPKLRDWLKKNGVLATEDKAAASRELQQYIELTGQAENYFVTRTRCTKS